MEEEFDIGRIMNKFRQFKLGNSLFKSSVSVAKDAYNSLSSEHRDVHIKNELVQRLSENIITHHSSAITKKDEVDYDCFEFNIQLLVLKMDEFKSIVESVIQELPDYKIIEIKKGKQL